MTISKNNRGFSLIEVLVTIIILMIGLLGLAGLQARALTSQMESYQRSQALILLKDMADRIEANRKNAASYVTTTPLGTGATCTAGTTRAALDLCAWNTALQGAAEQTGGSNIGAMIGARGCIYQIVAPAAGVPAMYQVVVTWQGMNSTFAPESSASTALTPTSTSGGECGKNLYKDRNNNIKEELHRVLTMPVFVADLN